VTLATIPSPQNSAFGRRIQSRWKLSTINALRVLFSASLARPNEFETLQNHRYLLFNRSRGTPRLD
jgi:hypothetical protein